MFFYDKEHNQAPFANPSVHPQGRALTPVQRQEVIRLASDGLRPTRIVSTFRRQTVSVTPRDVYNLIQAERNRNLAARPPLQALLDKLEGNEAEDPYFTQFDDQQRLTPEPLLVINCLAISKGSLQQVFSRKNMVD